MTTPHIGLAEDLDMLIDRHIDSHFDRDDIADLVIRWLLAKRKVGSDVGNKATN